MSYQEEVAVIIPAYNPDTKILPLLDGLVAAGFQHILVVDDGSTAACQPLFDTIAAQYDCVLLRHHVNLGKGRALKTAFNAVLNDCPGCVGAVTVDADGQHSVTDTVACAEALLAHPDCLILGCRDFSAEHIPARSRTGNVITRSVVRWLCGIRVSDTQTGLRAISVQHMAMLMNTKGERFEYEMNMLLDTKEQEIPLYEVPIQTIYIESNQSSHFNPLKDSFKIYSVFLKFLASSLSSSVLDILLFSIFIGIFKPLTAALYIYIGTVGARVLSALYNFILNKRRVFKSPGHNRAVFLKYAILCVVVLCVSAVSTKWLVMLLGWNEVLVKALVDFILFFINFQLQREWVFRRKAVDKQAG